jgi:hypothetical protein
MALLKKQMMTTTVAFFNGFATKTSDDNYPSLFQWFCYEGSDNGNVVAFFYGDGAMKNVIATNYRRLILWWWCCEEGNGNKLSSPYFFFFFFSYLILLA